ncbi:hypothetical protein JZ751_029710, partial [Albula glossodonta]
MLVRREYTAPHVRCPSPDQSAVDGRSDRNQTLIMCVAPGVSLPLAPAPLTFDPRAHTDVPKRQLTRSGLARFCGCGHQGAVTATQRHGNDLAIIIGLIIGRGGAGFSQCQADFENVSGSSCPWLVLPLSERARPPFLPPHHVAPSLVSRQSTRDWEVRWPGGLCSPSLGGREW